MSFWNDLLRNDYKGTGYIDGGRKQITRWLYSALLTNMPYDQFVAELVNPTADSQGFANGIVWRGVVNASQKPQMQAAQNVSQVFMGLNLKCASCHDSFINDWQLSDSYGLANIYSDQPLEIFQCDKPTGKKASTKFLYPELGEITASTNKQERLASLAKTITCGKDGRLSRTIVNRLWAKFMGRGLIEPVDDMEQTAWNQDLLDWLGQDLTDHHYDLKRTIETILTSRAYQMPAVDPGERSQADYVFTGPTVRRLSAEEFRDALASLTGIGYPSADTDAVPGTNVKAMFKPKVAVKWIWNNPNAAKLAKAEHVYLRKTLHLPVAPAEAKVVVVCDNAFDLFVNGKKAGAGKDYGTPFLIDLKPYLHKGDNVIAVNAVNLLPDSSEPTPANALPGTENPAGLFLYARVRGVDHQREKVMDFASDTSWTLTNQKLPGWEKPEFDAANWVHASALGAVNIQPWNLIEGFCGNRIFQGFRRQSARGAGGGRSINGGDGAAQSRAGGDDAPNGGDDVAGARIDQWQNTRRYSQSWSCGNGSAKEQRRRLDSQRLRTGGWPRADIGGAENGQRSGRQKSEAGRGGGFSLGHGDVAGVSIDLLIL